MFKCKHPAHLLEVKKHHTSVKQDEDFTKINYHLFCSKCDKDVNISFISLNGGVKDFLKIPCQKLPPRSKSR